MLGVPKSVVVDFPDLIVRQVQQFQMRQVSKHFPGSVQKAVVTQVEMSQGNERGFEVLFANNRDVVVRQVQDFNVRMHPAEFWAKQTHFYENCCLIYRPA